jgi:hypothetical protein
MKSLRELSYKDAIEVLKIIRPADNYQIVRNDNDYLVFRTHSYMVEEVWFYKSDYAKTVISIENTKERVNNDAIYLAYCKLQSMCYVLRSVSDYERNLKLNEKVRCAAIWYKEIEKSEKRNISNIDKGIVISGYRHSDIILNVSILLGMKTKENICGEYVQGFLTTYNRFVDREEAAIIAFNSGQIDVKKKELFSEDIY